MAKDLNKVLLIGRVGKDPELKYTEKGDAYCTFTVATGSSYKDSNGNDVERTEWHNIIAWRKLAEICAQYLKKGSKLYCEGRIRTSSQEKEGVRKYYTNIDLVDMIMLDSKSGSIKASESNDADIQKPGEDEDLPF